MGGFGIDRYIIFPFSRKFPDQNFASYFLYIFPCGTRSEPGLPVLQPDCLTVEKICMSNKYRVSIEF